MLLSFCRLYGIHMYTASTARAIYSLLVYLHYNQHKPITLFRSQIVELTRSANWRQRPDREGQRRRSLRRITSSFVRVMSVICHRFYDQALAVLGDQLRAYPMDMEPRS